MPRPGPGPTVPTSSSAVPWEWLLSAASSSPPTAHHLAAVAEVRHLPAAGVRAALPSLDAATQTVARLSNCARDPLFATARLANCAPRPFVRRRRQGFRRRAANSPDGRRDRVRGGRGRRRFAGQQGTVGQAIGLKGNGGRRRLSVRRPRSLYRVAEAGLKTVGIAIVGEAR